MKDELGKFNAAMDRLLKADPKIVKKAMEQERREREEERRSKHPSFPSSSSRKY